MDFGIRQVSSNSKFAWGMDFGNNFSTLVLCENDFTKMFQRVESGDHKKKRGGTEKPYE
jgi:hypothetical protein